MLSPLANHRIGEREASIEDMFAHGRNAVRNINAAQRRVFKSSGAYVGDSIGNVAERNFVHEERHSRQCSERAGNEGIFNLAERKAAAPMKASLAAREEKALRDCRKPLPR